MEILKWNLNALCGIVQEGVRFLVEGEILSWYEKSRVYIARGEYTEAINKLIDIKENETHYWAAQFQLGRIAQHTVPENNFRKSRIHWNIIPKESEAYWDAQYALGNLGERLHTHYKNIPIWHKRYYDGLFKLWCISAISNNVEKAAAYFYRLPDTYPNSWDFQRLFPLNKTTID